MASLSTRHAKSTPNICLVRPVAAAALWLRQLQQLRTGFSGVELEPPDRGAPCMSFFNTLLQTKDQTNNSHAVDQLCCVSSA